MTDSFSPAYDSARNFFRRRWRWVVGALVLYFIFGDYLAVFLGYAKTVTETVIENGESVGKETTSWLSPGARLLRDLFIAIAAVLGITMAGWRNFALDRQSNAASEQARNDSNRIAGEQFSNAVKLLAQKDAKNKPAIDARIGGIYSLQTLANNRIEKYGAQVVKTLIAYIKQNVQLTAHPPLKENETPQKALILGEDVKTAFNVLEQLLAAREKDSAEWNKPPDGIKLSKRDLSFSGQDFSRLDLGGDQVSGLNRYTWSWSNLQNTHLTGARLRGAILWEAKLQNANLSGVEMQGAHLWQAQLQGANLAWVQLQDADLSRAQLQGADLSNARLQGAKFWEAQLQGANLSGAQMQGLDLESMGLKYANLLEAKLSVEILSPILPDAEWDLSLFLRSGYALAGVLRNFALRYSQGNDDDKTRAKKLRMAAHMLDKKKLPDDFPQDWRDWLDGIESDGSHPDDSK